MSVARVYFEDGAFLTVNMNVSFKNIKNYYLGEIFDLSPWHKGENLQKCVKVEEVEE